MKKLLAFVFSAAFTTAALGFGMGSAGGIGCGKGEFVQAESVDTDGDGIVDTLDGCPNDIGPAPHGCPDGDGDGIHDAVDSCPAVYGLLANGCPDSDDDGIQDSLDDCPTVYGLMTGTGVNGCPDTDGDGVTDASDLCPTVYGLDGTGCPQVPDADGDGVPDSSDSCPNEYATTPDGCPPAPQTGDWELKVPASALAAVGHTAAELLALKSTGYRLHVDGQDAYPEMISAWCGMGFDSANGLIYTSCGGHANYGGNEVYRANIDAGTWERLNDASPYTGELFSEWSEPGQECRMPLAGPPASHTYAGPLWFPTRGTYIFPGYGITYTQANICTLSSDVTPNPYTFEYDPDTGANGTWTQHTGPTWPLSIGFSVYDSTRDKVFTVSGSGNQQSIDSSMNFVSTTWTSNKGDYHSGVYDPVRDVVWSVQGVSKYRLYKWTSNADYLHPREQIIVPAAAQQEFNAYPAIAYRQGLLWIYGGRDLVVYDPDADTWEIMSSNDPNAGGRTSSKFQYWPERDLFVYVTDAGAVWTLDPTKVSGTTIDPSANRAMIGATGYPTIQAALDASINGDTITIVPGTYYEGVRVDRDNITILADGVELVGSVYGNKSTFVQYGANLTIDGVSPYGLTVRDVNNISQNGSMVRMEPSASDLTVKNVQVLDTEGGIAITGGEPFEDPGYVNRGDVTFDGVKCDGCGGDAGQSHGTYIGYMVNFTVTNSEFLNGVGYGHLIKARPRNVTITNTTIDGGTGISSRLIDMPCGGALSMTDVVLTQSTNADNTELIGISLEDECYIPNPTITMHNVTATGNVTNTRFAKVHATMGTIGYTCTGTNSFGPFASPCP